MAVQHCDIVLARADAALTETVRLARERLSELPTDAPLLTHSASSTVREVFVGLPNPVLVTESEPGGEGRRLADRLGWAWLPDIEAPAACAKVAAVIVGADAIGPDAFVNKVGTGRLARAARCHATPFFVIAESFKRLPPGLEATAVGFFESTPNELVTAFLMDDVTGVSFATSPEQSAVPP